MIKPSQKGAKCGSGMRAHGCVRGRVFVCGGAGASLSPPPPCIHTYIHTLSHAHSHTDTHSPNLVLARASPLWMESKGISRVVSTHTCAYVRVCARLHTRGYTRAHSSMHALTHPPAHTHARYTYISHTDTQTHLHSHMLSRTHNRTLSHTHISGA